MTSGTSFSAAYVSGLAALMLERNPALKPDDLREILCEDGARSRTSGRDDFVRRRGGGCLCGRDGSRGGAGGPRSRRFRLPLPPKAFSSRQDAPATRALDQPAAAMASDTIGHWRNQSARAQ